MTEPWQPENTPCTGVRSCGEDARTDLMTGDHGNSFTQHNGKDVPQFAPNFTVYVLPPDVVCLYSEDRKFLLHGELYCALAAAIGKGWKELSGARSRAGEGFSVRQNPRSPEAAGRPPLCPPGIALFEWRRGRLLGEPRPVARGRGEKSPEMSCAHSINRRAGGNGTRRRPERAGRSRRQALPRPDGHVGERLSRSAIGRIEPAAFVGPYALGARPTLRHFSPGGTGVQTGARAPAGCVLPSG